MKNLISLFFLAILWSCNSESPSKKEVETSVEKEAAIIANSKYIKPASDLIRLNQLGYFPKAKKVGSVIVVGGKDFSAFSIINLQTGEAILTGNVGAQKNAVLAGETIQQFDFSALKEKGFYQIKVGEDLYSHPFKIAENIYKEVLPLVTKSYYYQRVSTEITEQHGGQWKRPAGHLDEKVFFHPNTGRTDSIASPKGWYDAGDFGKYISNGAFAAGQLLYTLERYPQLYPDGSLNIPESGNGINDLLDEIKYETDWIATMQDTDGGVFHKLTTKRFSGAIMPHEGDKPRFIMPKSSTATFDFAAILAKMARNYQQQDADQADKWLTQAKKAWDWGVQNPKVAFKNPADVVTGEYGDDDASEEQFWAAAELYIATKEQKYVDFISNNIPDFTYTYGDGWKSFMRYIGVFTLLNEKVKLPAEVKETFENRLVASVDDLTNRVETFDYQQGVNEFQWASNSDVQNVAFIIGEAHRISPKQKYVDAVLSSLNYLFGHNATGYSMITGLEDKSPMNVHHRQSEADGIKAPIPGFVCGGPNNHKQDAHELEYPENVSPMQSYVDVWESYASNEVCVNWNSPTPYILQFALEEGK